MAVRWSHIKDWHSFCRKWNELLIILATKLKYSGKCCLCVLGKMKRSWTFDHLSTKTCYFWNIFSINQKRPRIKSLNFWIFFEEGNIYSFVMNLVPNSNCFPKDERWYFSLSLRLHYKPNLEFFCRKLSLYWLWISSSSAVCSVNNLWHLKIWLKSVRASGLKGQNNIDRWSL